MLSLVKKIFGTAQSRKLKRYSRLVKKINTIEKTYSSLSDEELKQKTEEFKKRYKEGESLESLLPEAYAVVKNTCRRLCGTKVHVSGYDQEWDMVPYDVQLLGGIAMHNGSISEMQTGEGKTLTASLPLYLNALSGKPVHLVTVNDYLAARDCEWIGSIFRFHDLKVSALTNDVPPHERKAIYEADIVYGTASEFGFDYLRDNSMVQSAQEQVQRGHFFAIVDEVDSILIDEARTPLIISGPTSEEAHTLYEDLQKPVSSLVKKQRDFCHKKATAAKKVLENLHLLKGEEKPKLSKEEQKKKEEALKQLWLVSKGTPHNRILKRVKEDPDLRAEIENIETYFFGEVNKEERHQVLSELYLIVDERANDHELTDKGIVAWEESGGSADDFTMLDLGHEYGLIDQNSSLSQQDKIEKKTALREKDHARKERAHVIRQLFRADLLMEKDVDYIVQEEKIVIIDENTGRPQPGRRFSDGLHQAIEAKEGVAVQGATQTYATITLQNYFRLYEKLAGMTGTAMTEAGEFKEIYKLDVLEIPTNRKCVRKDFDDEIYMTEREKYTALLKEISAIHEQGRPILVGTESVEISEKLSRILKQNKLPHTVLNAKNHAKEAEIIAQAGKRGAITVATNMAGRGTDIKLEEGIQTLGGLYVIGTSRHQSRRIDRQLRGRCARQGDAGSSKFFISFEDPLMRLFTNPRLTSLLQRFRPPEGEPITAKMLNKSIETAQKRVENRNYSMRKHTLEYDDVLNKQRTEVYSFRNALLHEDSPLSIAEDVLEDVCMRIASKHFIDRTQEGAWNPKAFREELMTHFPVSFDQFLSEDEYADGGHQAKTAFLLVRKALRQKLEHQAQMIAAVQKAAGKEVNPLEVLSDILKGILLSRVDKHWQDHLQTIDHLRSEVGLRAIGQKDPLIEFKAEAFELFEKLTEKLHEDIAHTLFKFQMMPSSQENLQHVLLEAQQKHPFPPFIDVEESESEAKPEMSLV